MFKENARRMSAVLLKSELLSRGYGFICCSCVEFQAALEAVPEKFVLIDPLHVALQKSESSPLHLQHIKT